MRAPVMQLLRDETREHHERLERLVDLPALTRSADAYAAVLGRFATFYRALEPAVGACVGLDAALTDVRERTKLPALRADLAALGAPVALGRPTVPDVSTVPRALGALYVIEGSTLGGAQIARAVPGRPAAYFASYGSERGAMWKRFGAALQAHADAVPDAPPRMVAAARETFDALGAWLVPAPTELAA